MLLASAKLGILSVLCVYCYFILLEKFTTKQWHGFLAQGRYEIMRNYMPKVGSLGLDMMFRTCTVQVSWNFQFLMLWTCFSWLASLWLGEKMILWNSDCADSWVIHFYRSIWTLVRRLTWSANFVLVLLCSLWETSLPFVFIGFFSNYEASNGCRNWNR